VAAEFLHVTQAAAALNDLLSGFGDERSPRLWDLAPVKPRLAYSGFAWWIGVAAVADGAFRRSGSRLRFELFG
jgi:hypothetical protein